MCLNSSYRKVLLFSYEALDNAKKAYFKLKKKVESLKDEGSFDSDYFTIYDEKFKKALSDDLNTANAISLIYDVLKSDMNDFTKLKLIENFDKVLSLDLLEEKEMELDKEVLELVELRNKYKLEKNYQMADEIRQKIVNLGYKILDTRDGTKIEKI